MKLNNSLGQFLSPEKAVKNLNLGIFVAYVIVTGILTPAPNNRQLNISWNLLDLINMAGFLLVIFVIRKFTHITYLKILTAVATGLLAQTGVIWIKYGSSIPKFVISGFPIGIITYFAILLSITVIVSAASESRRAFKILIQDRESLSALSGSLQDQYEEAKASLSLQVSEAISGAVSEFRNGAANLHKESMVLLLQKAINEVIRPLSHRIEKEEIQLELAVASNGIRKFNFIGFFTQKVRMGTAISPLLLALILGGTILPTYSFVIDFKALLVLGIPTTILAVLTLFALKTFLSELKVSAFVAYLLNICTAIGIFLEYNFMNSLFGKKYGSDELTLFSSGGLLTSIFVGICSVFFAARLSAIEGAQEVNLEIAELISSIRSNLWSFRKAVARGIHGGVQGKLQAAAIKLARSESVTDELLKEIQSDIAEAEIAVTNYSQGSKSFTQSIDELAQLWRGGCDVEFSADPAAIRSIELNQIATECALEVINEVITNAVKNGGAEFINIKAEIKGDLLQLKITNPILKDGGVNPESLGTKVISEATQNWSSSSDGKTFTVRATIFLGSR